MTNAKELRRRQCTAALEGRNQDLSVEDRWFAKGVAMAYGVIASELEKESNEDVA